MTTTSASAGRARLRRFLPVLTWLPGYTRTDGVADLKAGATVAVLLIPQAMAYAALAGVPPITGLYAAMVSLVVYAVFGTSRFISVGPVAIDSLLTAAAVAPLADGDSARYVALTGVLTLMVGLIQVAGGLARLGALVNLLSVPVIAGFTSAAALTIAASQLKDFLGLQVEGSSTSFVESIGALLPALSGIDPVTTALGVAALVALVTLRRWLPSLPGPLLVVGTAAVVVVLGDLQVSQVGQIPSGIPVPALPDVGWSDLGPLLPSAAAIALISFMESISTGKAFARRTRTSTEPDQELIAVGLSNALSGVMKGMPVAGGFSRGAVNFNAGARTPMSGVVAAALVVVSLLLLTPVLAYIPKVVLAAIILAAVASLIDVKGAIEVWRIRRSDLLSLLVTAAATLLLGPSLGLGVGVLVSFGLFLRHLTRPHLPELGYAPDKGAFRNVQRHRVRTHPQLLVMRVDAPLSFVGARAISDVIGEQVQRRSEVSFLVLDASAVTDADYTGVEMLGELVDQLDESGVTLHLAALRGPVSDVLGRAAWFRDLREAGRVHDTVVRAVDSLPLELDDATPAHRAGGPGDDVSR